MTLYLSQRWRADHVCIRRRRSAPAAGDGIWPVSNTRRNQPGQTAAGLRRERVARCSRRELPVLDKPWAQGCLISDGAGTTSNAGHNRQRVARLEMAGVSGRCFGSEGCVKMDRFGRSTPHIPARSSDTPWRCELEDYFKAGGGLAGSNFPTKKNHELYAA